MSYFYRIGYHSFENSDHVVLLHDERFSREDISRMIADALRVIRPEFIARFVSNNPSFENLFSGADGVNGIPEWLVSNRGFRKLDLQCDWSAMGWANVTEKDNWRSYREQRDVLDEVREFLEGSLPTTIPAANLDENPS